MPDVFVSHGGSDHEVAHKLADELKSKGLSTWDERQLQAGDDWKGSIASAIANSNNVLVVLSKDSNRSEWLRTEVAMALADSKKRVVPVVVSKDAEIPFLLRNRQSLDMTDAQAYAHRLAELVAVLRHKPTDDGFALAQFLESEKLLLEAEKRHQALAVRSRDDELRSNWIARMAAVSLVAFGSGLASFAFSAHRSAAVVGVVAAVAAVMGNFFADGIASRARARAARHPEPRKEVAP